MEMKNLYSIPIFYQTYEKYQEAKKRNMQKINHNEKLKFNNDRMKKLNSISTSYFDKICGYISIDLNDTDIFFRVFKCKITGRRFQDACRLFKHIEIPGLHFPIYNLDVKLILDECIEKIKSILNDFFKPTNYIDLEKNKIILKTLLENEFNTIKS